MRSQLHRFFAACGLLVFAGCAPAPAFDGVFETTLLGQATLVHLTQTGSDVSGYAQAGTVKSVLAAKVDTTGRAASGTLNTVLGEVRFEATVKDAETLLLTYPGVGMFPGGNLTLTRKHGD